MHPEIEQALIAASAGMVDNPVAWADLPVEAQQLFEALLGNPSFSDTQRYYLNRWWLRISDERLEQINQLCPHGFRFAARSDGGGDQYVCADILTDALGGTLRQLEPLIVDLELHYKLPDHWPEEPALLTQ